MEGCIVSIHIASAPGAPMTAITTAHLMPGRGIEGDRFYASRGNDAASDATTCDVTFVEQEALEALKSEEPQTDSGDTARRNMVIRGCSLEQLIGRTFRIGDVVLRGLAPHESCASENTHQATRCMALSHADLRAQILTEGRVSVGDRLQAV
jgi:MOSC domain-containing protein YiiM